MGWRVFWAVTCDECGAVSNQRWRGKTPGEDALKAATKKGWLERRVHYSGIYCHLCPNCLKDPPDWWPKEDAT